MTSHQTSRRPRPSRPSPFGPGGDYDYDDGDRAPFGSRLRSAMFRVPGKRGSIAAITVGCALFVAASIATPIAAADKSNKHQNGTRRTALHTTPLQLPTASPSTAQAAPAGRKTLSSKPVHSTQPAPVTKAVITGLAANGIPNVALNAYRVAAARMANVEPSCGIDWALLAGIGREESDHGQFGGATLHANGVSTPPIVGPALDGIHWDYIPVSAQYISITGDRTFAHALGPMQFIPSTWSAYGADANNDGKVDIFNINDAALGAARYLCAAGGNLRTHAGQVAAVLAYNHSDQYLAQVLALAADYRNGVKVSGIPVGITTGNLPTVPNTGYVPPANPAPPTAVDPGASKTAKSQPKPKTPAKPTKPSGTKPSGSHSTGTGTGSGSGGTGTGGGTGGGGTGGGTGVLPTQTTGAGGGGGGGLLPTKLPTLLPKPTTTKKATPTASSTKTCVLNLVGICI